MTPDRALRKLIALRRCCSSPVHCCSSASQAALYLPRTYKFGHRPTKAKHLRLFSQAKGYCQDTTQLFDMEKKIWTNYMPCWFAKWGLLSLIYLLFNLTTISSTESTFAAPLFAILWTSLCNLANVKMPPITSGGASHDITETDSESSICCYHP